MVPLSSSLSFHQGELSMSDDEEEASTLSSEESSEPAMDAVDFLLPPLASLPPEPPPLQVQPLQLEGHSSQAASPASSSASSSAASSPHQASSSTGVAAPSLTQTSGPRVPKACSACRKRKRRCDGGHPCSSCVKANKPLSCSYQQAMRRRGPQAGMVQRLRDQVKNLQAQLEHAQAAHGGMIGEASPHPLISLSSSSSSSSSSSPTFILSLFQQPDSARKVPVYRATFFRLLNDTLFPMLSQADFDRCYDDYIDSLSTAPAVWHLTLAAVLAHGAHIWGDFAFASEATDIARAAAAPLFDQPSSEVIRGLLVLSYHCLSDNALSRTSCYLATITRMCEIVDMPPQIPLLVNWLEDMLCAIRTFAYGLRTMPEGSYQQQQRSAFPQDWARYERLVRYHRQPHKRSNSSRRGGKEEQQGRSVATQSSASSSTPASAASSSEPPSTAALDFTGPPDPADLDDRNLRWELVQTLCALSESKGEYNHGSAHSIYRHLCVLVKAEQSRYTAGLIMSTVAFCKSQALFFVNEQAEAVEMARMATRSMLTHDITHCAFYALQAHFLCQVHLRMNDYQHLAISLAILRTVASKWKLAIAPLQHIEQIVQHAISHPTSPFIPNLDDPTEHPFEPVQMLPPEDRQQAESFFHSSLQQANNDHQRHLQPTSPPRELSPRSFSNRSTQLLSILHHQGFPFPSLMDAAKAIDGGFPYTFHPPPNPTTAAITLAGGRHVERQPLEVVVASLELPSSPHPHPHLSSLRPGPTTVLRMKQEEIQVTPNAFTRASTQLPPIQLAPPHPPPRKTSHGAPSTHSLLPEHMTRETSSPAVVQHTPTASALADDPFAAINRSPPPLPLPSSASSFPFGLMDELSVGPFMSTSVSSTSYSQRVQYEPLISPDMSDLNATAPFPTFFDSPFLSASARLAFPSPTTASPDVTFAARTIHSDSRAQQQPLMAGHASPVDAYRSPSTLVAHALQTTSPPVLAQMGLPEQRLPAHTPSSGSSPSSLRQPSGGRGLPPSHSPSSELYPNLPR